MLGAYIVSSRRLVTAGLSEWPNGGQIRSRRSPPGKLASEGERALKLCDLHATAILRNTSAHSG